MILIAITAAAYLYRPSEKPLEQVSASSAEIIRAADGDSFSIGTRKLRLRGIDATELAQTCRDSNNASWACGTAAQGALMQYLAQPGLTCNVTANDRFGRGLATCATSETPDIAAGLVAGGFAVSQQFNGIADYGAEQKQAQQARRGIWRGEFTPPREWRDRHPRGKTPRAEAGR